MEAVPAAATVPMEAAPVEVVLMEAVLAAVQLVPAEAVDPVEAARVQITTNQIQMARQAR